MRLKQKLMLATSAVAAFSAFLLSFVLTVSSQSTASDIVSEQVKQRMIGLRDAKKEQIESYFGLLEGQLLTLANSRMLKDSAGKFVTSFNEYQLDIPVREQTRVVSNYYQNEYLQEYKKKNNTVRVSTEQLMDSLSPVALALQYQFIGNNPHALGEKDKLTSIDDGSFYDKTHARYHSSLSAFLKEFDLYDIFIIDAENGNVVYSVFKEVDFATSLKSGTYRDSGLAEAYEQAMQLSPGEVAFIDFKTYKPSYEAPASFIATQVTAENGTIGVLVFQMPVDSINAIMTYNGEWKTRGLGDSGETYLVGGDKKMRSLSRGLIEDKEAYLRSLEASGKNQDIIEEINLKNTSIGLKSIDSGSVNKALNGQTGFEIVNDYEGIAAASAYAPIDVLGSQWIILSKIDKDEAFAAISTLTSKLRNTSIITTLIVIAISIVIAGLLANVIVKPISRLIKVVNKSSENLDLTLMEAHDLGSSRDEIYELASAFKKMNQAFTKTINQVHNSSRGLMTKVGELTQNFDDVTKKTGQQKGYAVSAATAVEEMSQSSIEVAKNTKSTLDISNMSVEFSNEGQVNVNDTISANQKLVEAMNQNTRLMNELDEQSRNVGAVLEVISGVAEQTNLLALNAAIEAARAGEQGRGFAVVADEVRSLAQRTEESTQEIQGIIQTVQNGASQAVKSINDSMSIAEDTLSYAKKAGESLDIIGSKLNEIQTHNAQVATAAAQQSDTAVQMAEQVNNIGLVSKDNFSLTQQANELVQEVRNDAEKLESAVSRFNVAV